MLIDGKILDPKGFVDEYSILLRTRFEPGSPFAGLNKIFSVSVLMVTHVHKRQ